MNNELRMKSIITAIVLQIEEETNSIGGPLEDRLNNAVHISASSLLSILITLKSSGVERKDIIGILDDFRKTAIEVTNESSD